jgi:hydrogenase expression/formation protein HypE
MGTHLLAGGKLPSALLNRLLSSLPTEHPQLLLGPGVGEDAAVIEFTPGRLLVAKSDPITFATDEIGYYAVNVCANDLAVTGATPRFYLPTLLLPVNSMDEAAVAAIFSQLADACRTLGIIVAGGHSEVTRAVNQPLIAGTMLGEVDPNRFLRSSGCRPGDLILLAGSVPVEGTSIIARERRQDLLARGWPVEEVEQAAGYLYDPGISVLPPALAAAQSGLATAMHDPTEGGIATGLLELSVAAQSGLEVDLDAIEVPEISARLCALYGLNPLGTIASGALLATTPAENAGQLQALWTEIGWPSRIIGRILPPEEGIYALRNGQKTAPPRFDADEIVKL